MKKLTILLLFITLCGYAQIDYKGLVKNLEDITFETDIKTHFKGIPFKEEYSQIEFSDERFLRFYDIIVDKVSFENNWGGRTMTMKLFNEKSDYNNIKTKLIELYGEPEINERSSSIFYEWKTDKVNTTLRIKTEEGKFTEFDELVVTLIQ